MVGLNTVLLRCQPLNAAFSSYYLYPKGAVENDVRVILAP